MASFDLLRSADDPTRVGKTLAPITFRSIWALNASNLARIGSRFSFPVNMSSASQFQAQAM